MAGTRIQKGRWRWGDFIGAGRIFPPLGSWREPFLQALGPDRGKRCEPAHTRRVAEKIASLRGLSLEETARATSQAAEKFFRLQ
ncbi:MAG: TatD family hydrolase [Verrucomicrobiota bacterium]